MERPKGEKRYVERQVTGEIVYLDEMRRRNLSADDYTQLDPVKVDHYEAIAAQMRENDTRPKIMQEYEKYDNRGDRLARSCTQLAEELYKLKDPDSFWSFESIQMEMTPAEALERIKQTSVSELLTSDDEQLAIESNGEYYPILDIRKKDMTLTGADLRVYGWSSQKYAYTNMPRKQYKFPKDFLLYPNGETVSWYEIELMFGYQHPEAGSVTESLSLSISELGNVRLGREIWAAAYAETGYEGHNGKSLKGDKNQAVTEFADFVAKVVGDEPKAVNFPK